MRHWIIGLALALVCMGCGGSAEAPSNTGPIFTGEQARVGIERHARLIVIHDDLRSALELVEKRLETGSLNEADLDSLHEHLLSVHALSEVAPQPVVLGRSGEDYAAVKAKINEAITKAWHGVNLNVSKRAAKLTRLQNAMNALQAHLSQLTQVLGETSDPTDQQIIQNQIQQVQSVMSSRQAEMQVESNAYNLAVQELQSLFDSISAMNNSILQLVQQQLSSEG